MLGNIGPSKTGDTIEFDIDYSAKKLAFTRVGGNTISEAITPSLTTQPMHLFLTLGKTGQEVELKVI